MAGNTIAVRISGDSTEFVKAANSAGAAAKKASDETSSGLVNLGEKADKSVGKLRGVSDGIDGTSTALGALGVAIPGPVGTVLTFTRGITDLTDSFGALAPVLDLMKTKLGFTTAATEAETAATGEAEAAQVGLNTAFLLSPVGLILVGLAALVALFVELWKHCTTFRDTVKSVFAEVVSIVEGAGGVFKKVGDAILEPYKLAFNAIADAWNGTLGKLHVHIPGFLGFGGLDFSIPQIPHFAAGGVMAAAGMALVGESGPELIQLPGGSQVFNNHTAAQMAGGGVNITLAADSTWLGNFVTATVDSGNRTTRNAVNAGARRRTA